MNDSPQLPGPAPYREVGPTTDELCTYVAEMCAELRALTRRPSFRTLNYLLDMARLEAERMSKDLRAGGGAASVVRGR